MSGLLKMGKISITFLIEKNFSFRFNRSILKHSIILWLLFWLPHPSWYSPSLPKSRITAPGYASPAFLPLALLLFYPISNGVKQFLLSWIKTKVRVRKPAGPPPQGSASPASETAKRLRHKAAVPVLVFCSCTGFFLFLIFCTTRIYSVSFWPYSVADPAEWSLFIQNIVRHT